MIGWLLDSMVSGFIQQGTLVLRLPDGTTRRYGSTEPEATVSIADWRTARRLIVNPGLALGEAYMDGQLRVTPTLDVLSHLAFANVDASHGHPVAALRAGVDYWMRWLQQFAPRTRARRNVAHHYDLNGALYDLFLDEDRQYSCAYFATGAETLEEAQRAKKRLVAAKLRLTRPGLRVLDVGSGWGGLALTLARDYEAEVLGITLSHEQLAASRARAEAAAVSDRVRFELRDYRDVRETFDRVVSVGMFEHVGVSQYHVSFDLVRQLLADDGVALIHTIGRLRGPSVTNPWLRKYIFPGGYCPALSEIMPHVERSGLLCTDIEVLRRHYARTLRHWRHRFQVKREAIVTLYDERFFRMFDLYLAGAEQSFQHLGLAVWQIQLARGIDTIPVCRDYLLGAAGPVAAPVESRPSLTDAN